MSALIAGLLAIWFLCLGLAIILRQHQRFLRWSWQQAQRPFLWLWQNYQREIIWFLAGIGFAKLFLK